MEEYLPMYHFQASKDPYSGVGQPSQWMTTTNIEDIIDAYNEYNENREVN